ADSDPRALDVAGLEDLLRRAPREARRNGEADPAPAADDHRVDPEDAPVEVAERTAGVAGVDARVGLQVVLDRVHAEPAAPLRAEHARRDGVAESEGRSDGDDPLADARRVRVRELRGDEAGRVDLDDGEVRRRIAPDEARGEETPVA